MTKPLLILYQLEGERRNAVLKSTENHAYDANIQKYHGHEPKPLLLNIGREDEADKSTAESQQHLTAFMPQLVEIPKPKKNLVEHHTSNNSRELAKNSRYVSGICKHLV